ncbi:hypothetical protein EZS27_023696 [termite gut metagenome]|uniref:RloB domain-containing protein n=1 Tax=termite gut metagenome TaxID=433724 RepID=A0A5J4R2X8_9ZZZZ
MSRYSNYSISIICEGTRTEKLFFESIRDEIQTEKNDCVINVYPRNKTEINESNETNRGAYKGRKRQTNKGNKKFEIEEIKGALPLKWIEEGRRHLEDGRANEAWAVFDKDRHPKAKEAFELAEKEINGMKVNIAFSSICFEYYLLLHFECIYRKFDQCEEVNEYARKKQYWKETKKENSTYNIVKDRLQIGFADCAWLRFTSDEKEKDIPVYKRNPYTNVDKLVCKLIGEKEWKYWDTRTPVIVEYEQSHLKMELLPDGSIRFTNEGNHTFIIPENSFSIIDSETGTQICTKGQRCSLLPGQEKIEYWSDWKFSNSIFIHLKSN